MASAIPVQGLTELRKAVLDFPKKLQRRALDKSMAAGARVIVAEARRLAPVRTGAVRRNIVAKRGQKRYAPSADSYWIIGVRHGKTNTNTVTAGGRTRRVSAYDRKGEDPFYWRFQNLGYTAVGRRPAVSGAKKRRGVKAAGRWIPPKRFMERGFAAGTPRALDKFRETMTAEIAKVAAK